LKDKNKIERRKRKFKSMFRESFSFDKSRGKHISVFGSQHI
jgi:hypothetical protein